MNTTLPYYLFTGFFIIAAIQQLLIGVYSKRKKMNLAFASFVIIGAIYEINMIALLKANSSQESEFFINISRVVIILGGIVQMLFVSLYCRIYFKRMLMIISVLSVLTIVITLMNPLHTNDMNFSQIHLDLFRLGMLAATFTRVDMFVLLLNYLSLILFLLYTMLVLVKFYQGGQKAIAILLLFSFGVKLILDLGLNFHSVFNSYFFNNEHGNMILIGAICLLISIDLRNGVILKQKMEFESELKKFKNQKVRYIVHEFKTTLDMLNSITVNDSKDKILDVTNTCSANMLDIVGNMLEVYKYNEGALRINKSELDISEVIDEALRSVAHSANKKNIEFNLNLNSNCALEADGDLLKRLFVNLFQDVIKCLTDNTKIIINSSCTLNNGFSFNLTAPHLNTSSLNVTKLFEGNELGKKDIQRLSFSTGISLMFCKIVVEGHNGEIGLDNSDGKTSIWLSFPNAYKNIIKR